VKLIPGNGVPRDLGWRDDVNGLASQTDRTAEREERCQRARAALPPLLKGAGAWRESDEQNGGTFQVRLSRQPNRRVVEMAPSIVPASAMSSAIETEKSETDGKERRTAANRILRQVAEPERVGD